MKRRRLKRTRTSVKYSEGSSCFRLLEANKLVGWSTQQKKKERLPAWICHPCLNCSEGHFPSPSHWVPTFKATTGCQKEQGGLAMSIISAKQVIFGTLVGLPIDPDWLALCSKQCDCMDGKDLSSNFNLKFWGPSKPQLRHVTQGVGCPLEKEGSMWH